MFYTSIKSEFIVVLGYDTPTKEGLLLVHLRQKEIKVVEK